MPRNQPAATILPLCFETPAQPEALPTISQQVMAAAREQGISPDVLQRLDLVLEEALMNTALHGYGGKGGGMTVKLDFVDDGCLKLTLEDCGVPFDPTTASTPDLSIPVEERPIGGLGIHLIRSMSDTLTYHRDGKRNILTLVLCPGKTV